MKILVTGATGFIGSALTGHLHQIGHEIVSLVRNKSQVDQATTFHWDPINGEMDGNAFKGVDGVIHLAGENIAKGRWTQRRKESLFKSRVESTRLLVQFIESMKHPPAWMFNASAVGIYGDDGSNVKVETSPPANDFLGKLGSAWEQELFELNPERTRGVALRFGLVLSPQGGALKTMLPSFKCGVGAVLGSGQQFVPWITLNDVLGVITHCMDHPDVKGPVNCVTPNPVRFDTFAKTLGQVIRRPVWLRIPETMVGWIFGEMGTATLLSSCRAEPEKLVESGFKFLHPELTEALQDLLDT